MTQSIRDAAQALLDALDNKYIEECSVEMLDLRAALAAPQPTADERTKFEAWYCSDGDYEPSELAWHPNGFYVNADTENFWQGWRARALLGAAQEDVEHAAMYRWLRERGGASWSIYPEGRPKEAVHATGKYYDEAVRSAMKEKKA